MRRTALLCLLSIAFAGCSSELHALSPAGSAVRVGKLDPPDGNVCAELGLVYGGGQGDAQVSPDAKMRSAQNELRNNAAARGGNYVTMDAASGSSQIALAGRAFKCIKPVGMLALGPGVVLPTATAACPAAAAVTPETRLRMLKDLLDKGLVTKDEYDRRRAEILQSI